MSLSFRSSHFRAEPKRESFRIQFLLQKSAILSRGSWISVFMLSLPLIVLPKNASQMSYLYHHFARLPNRAALRFIRSFAMHLYSIASAKNLPPTERDRDDTRDEIRNDPDRSGI
jgi:hypothetical protein